MRGSPAMRELERMIERVGPRPRVRGPVVPTGIRSLDQLLPGGGLPRGRAVEWSGPRSCGKTSLLKATFGSLRARGESVVLIDASRTLYAPDWVDLVEGEGRCWVIRPRSPGEAAWCADLILRSGAFGAVALEAGVMRRSVTVRLQRLAEEASAVFVVVAEIPVAALRLRFRAARIEPVRHPSFGSRLPPFRPIWVQIGKGGATEVPLLCPPVSEWAPACTRDRSGPR